MVAYCPKCGGKLLSRERAIGEHGTMQVILWCDQCDKFALDSDTHFVGGTDVEVVSQLTTRLEDLQRDQEARDSEDRDIRWTQF